MRAVLPDDCRASDALNHVRQLLSYRDNSLIVREIVRQPKSFGGDSRGTVSGSVGLQLPTSVQGEFISQLNVDEPPHAAPHNGIAWRRIAGSGEIAPKPGDLDQVSQEWRCLRGKRQVGDYALEQFYFR